MKLSWALLGLCLFSLAWGQFFEPVLRRDQKHSVAMPRTFSPSSVKEAFFKAAEIIEGRRNTLAGRKRTPSLSRNSPEARHQRFQLAHPRSRTLESVQERFEEATRVLLGEFNLTPDQIKYGLAGTDLKSILKTEFQQCMAQFNVTDCRRTDRYRTYDGTCNNLRHPSWGMAGSCFERLVEPAYADGTSSKRVALSGNPLPPPRRVSLDIHNHFDKPSAYLSHMFMVWGQFLDHDISLTPLSLGPDNEFLECCPVNANDPPNCDPILIDSDDPFYKAFGIDCLSNQRSAICSTCSLGPRQQINQVTAYIDASHIYGLNQNASRRLRSNDGRGTLRSVMVNGIGELPPGSFMPNEDQCSFQDPQRDCFQTGDQRANQHPALTSLHVIFLREHNRIARTLKEMNPRWDDEKLFQETRRIIGAEMQTITYGEYVPLILGPERTARYHLNVQHTDRYTEYDEAVQATLVNEFSAAAYRFGHSMINGFFQNARGGNYLRDIFNFPFGIYNGELEGLVEGLTASPSQRFDRYMVRDVTNHLYQQRGNDSGLDLAALNINRARDHGIPGYTTFVEFCGGRTITSFRQLDRLFRKGVRPLFERLYERVEDIDLFSGGLAERPNPGAVVGPTFICIMGIQFYHLKYGDRFYFEHGGQAGSFTPAQLQELRKVTLSKIICDNTDIDELPGNAFVYAGEGNRIRRCSDKPAMNLGAWRE